MNKRIVLTGGPGSGKSSVSDVLGKQYKVIPEVARHYLKFFEENMPYYLPWNNRDIFQNFVEIRQLENHIKNEFGYFDRSFIDEIAYRKFFGIAGNPKLTQYAAQFRFDKVFFFPYWDEIYVQDEQRIETKAQAQLQEHLLLEAYKNVGYNPIIVPKTTIEERVTFIQLNS